MNTEGLARALAACRGIRSLRALARVANLDERTVQRTLRRQIRPRARTVAALVRAVPELADLLNRGALG